MLKTFYVELSHRLFGQQARNFYFLLEGRLWHRKREIESERGRETKYPTHKMATRTEIKKRSPIQR